MAVKTSVEDMEAVANFINSEFPNLNSLSKATELLEQYKTAHMNLEQQLTYASTEAPSKIDQAVEDAQHTADKIDKFSVDTEQVSDDIANHTVDIAALVRNLSKLTDQIKELECYSKYLQMVGQIEDLSSDIQSSLIIGSVDRSVTKFSEMAELTTAIQASKCENLVRFSNDTLIFWYNILKDKFSSEFEEVLTAYNWPFIVSTKKPGAPPQNIAEIKKKLDPLFTNLLHLQLPEGLSVDQPASHPFLKSLPDWRPLILPVQLMIKPLKKRFKYHFYGKKQTNSLDKPEWYFTTILTWVKHHKDFLLTKIQPILDAAGLQYIDAVVEFSRGLVLLAMEKLLMDVPEMMYDETTFSHLIDEALAFDKELRTSYGYPANQLGCLHILSENEPFDKWIVIEQKYASEKMDSMMSASTAWESQFRDVSDVDDLKVPECGATFITLMLTITERYKPLPYMSHKLKFLELQLGLLDDYRIRLLQIKNGEASRPLGQTFSAILNTVNYVSEVLREWRELLFFLQIQYFKTEEEQSRVAVDDEESEGTPVTQSFSNFSIFSLTQPSLVQEGSMTSLEGSLFDEMIQLYDMMKNDMMNTILSYVLDDVKARSRPYRKDKWVTHPSQKDLGALNLSPSACEMFLVLRDHLHHMQGHLSKTLFTSFWQSVAQDLDKFLFEELILANHFNEGGSAQVNFDMTRNLFPLFGQYTQKSENYFKSTKEACILLTLNVGTAILLKSDLYEALHNPSTDSKMKVTDPVAIMQEIGISRLLPEDAELVLSLRTNLST